MTTVAELMKFLSHADPNAEVLIGEEFKYERIVRLYSSLDGKKFYVTPTTYSDMFGR